MNLGLIEIPSSIKKLLTFFRERRNNTGVNATTPYHQIQAIGQEANIGLALSPKGGGAFTLQVPDGGVSGGDVRGVSSIDFQIGRTLASQVASGIGSVIIGGSSNQASGSGSGIFCGSENIASTSASVVIGGQLNTASGVQYSGVFVGRNNRAQGIESVVVGGSGGRATNFQSGVFAGRNGMAQGAESVVLGGLSNTASADDSAAIGGRNSTASGLSSVVFGQYATTNGISGSLAYGFLGGTLGRNQMSFFGARAVTTAATATTLTADAAAASASNQLTLRNNSSFLVSGRIIARDNTNNTAAAWEFTNVLITRGAAAANTAIVGNHEVRLLQSNMAATPTLVVQADTTNGALQLVATPGNTNSTGFTAVLHSIEVTA